MKYGFFLASVGRGPNTCLCGMQTLLHETFSNLGRPILSLRTGTEFEAVAVLKQRKATQKSK